MNIEADSGLEAKHLKHGKYNHIELFRASSFTWFHRQSYSSLLRYYALRDSESSYHAYSTQKFSSVANRNGKIFIRLGYEAIKNLFTDFFQFYSYFLKMFLLVLHLPTRRQCPDFWRVFEGVVYHYLWSTAILENLLIPQLLEMPPPQKKIFLSVPFFIS
jgi:hypothetical protein